MNKRHHEGQGGSGGKTELLLLLDCRPQLQRQLLSIFLVMRIPSFQEQNHAKNGTRKDIVIGLGVKIANAIARACRHARR